MSRNDPRVLVFDSGVGGLSVLAELRQQAGLRQFIYAADNGFFPYGEKEDEVLVQRVGGVIHQLVQRYSPDILVVACNTASTIVLPHIRSQLQLPVVGVVPAIKPAAVATKSKVIGLLATPATVHRPYTQQLVDQFAHDCRVIRVGSSELVVLAEAKLRGESIDIEKIRGILHPFHQETAVDVIILGCTHFPLLKEELIKALGRDVRWLDSGIAVAQQTLRVLKADGWELGECTAHEMAAVFTADTKEMRALQPHLKTMGFTSFEVSSF